MLYIFKVQIIICLTFDLANALQQRVLFIYFHARNLSDKTEQAIPMATNAENLFSLKSSVQLEPWFRPKRIYTCRLS